MAVKLCKPNNNFTMNLRLFGAFLLSLAVSSFFCGLRSSKAQTINLNTKEEIGVNDSLHFGILKDLKTDKKGNIYITDLKAIKVYKFSHDNKLLSQTGRSGKGPGEFLGGPSTLAICGNKLVVFDLSAAKRAEVYNTKNLKYKTSKYLRPVHYASLNDRQQLLMNYHNYLNNTYLHVYNFNSNKLYTIHQKNITPYPRLNHFEIFSLPKTQYTILVYLYYNRVDILNEKFDVIKRLSLPDLPVQAPAYKPKSAKRIISHFRGKKAKIIERASYLPKFNIFKGAAVSPNGNIYLQTGTVKKPDKRLTYVLSLNGDVISTLKLPFNEELVEIDNKGFLYTITDTKVKAYRYKINYQNIQ